MRCRRRSSRAVRREAIDTLETHFENDHQELLGGRAARDLLLDQLGFRAGDEVVVPEASHKGFNMVVVRSVLLGVTSLATAITLLSRIF